MYEGDPLYAPVEAFADELFQRGVQHVCVCPGARSTPLALTFANHPGPRAWSHVDERSAAFFALGIAKATRRPAAVVCTSGTAAANFLPALIEARYAHVPLLALTADRPPELRDCGAGQTIDQVRLYGPNVKWFAEAGMPETGERYFRSLAARAVAAATASPPGPVHVNFPFREPLVPAFETAAGPRAPLALQVRETKPIQMPAAETQAWLEELFRSARRPLIVCGPCDADEGFARAVCRLAGEIGCPVLADPLSQVRTGAHDRSLVVARYDAFLRDETVAARMAPDLIVRCGAPPTSKALLQYFERHATCTQVVIDPLGFWRDPTLLAVEAVRADPNLLFDALADRLHGRSCDADWSRLWLDAEGRAESAIVRRLEEMHELFEGKVFSELSRVVPEDAVVYVANSMPVRDLDGFWPPGSVRVRFLCNRGANGIDGFVSSGLGAAAVSDVPVILVTGDLGFYHDLNGLLAVRRHGLRATIILLNNNGGGIFGFLPQAGCGAPFEEFFTTPHALDFRLAVEMYGGTFVRVAGWSEFRDAVGTALTADGTTVIEVPVDRARNVETHRRIWEDVAACVAGAQRAVGGLP